jgi:O-acetyl-ADP-ribose deacetylase (regulator of RNase III)
MIKYLKGDIFTTLCEAIGHGCNCQGIAGKGIIVEIARYYPAAIKAYKTCCRHGNFYPGCIQVVPCQGRFIVNMGTQKEIKKGKRGGAKVGFIRKCLEEIVKRKDFNSIAFPRIGCNLGGLNW